MEIGGHKENVVRVNSLQTRSHVLRFLLCRISCDGADLDSISQPSCSPPNKFSRYAAGTIPEFEIVGISIQKHKGRVPFAQEL